MGKVTLQKNIWLLLLTVISYLNTLPEKTLQMSYQRTLHYNQPQFLPQPLAGQMGRGLFLRVQI